MGLAQRSLGVHVLAHVRGTGGALQPGYTHGHGDMGLQPGCGGARASSDTRLCVLGVPTGVPELGPVLGVPVLGAACSQPPCTAFMSVRP